MILFFVFDNESEKELFDFLFSQYKNLLFAKALEILHDRALAEDAVSEAFIRIYKNLHKITDPRSNQTVAFVVIIVKNVALTMWRREKRFAYEELNETVPDEAEQGYGLEEQVLFSLSKAALFKAMEQLGDEQKHIFLLKYAYDLPHKEIARQLHISENNVTVKLHRARKSLTEILRKEGRLDDVQ